MVTMPFLMRFQSTPSARRATGYDPLRIHPNVISIHALREESDQRLPQGAVLVERISIHALREESDTKNCATSWFSPIFQSTPSARRATASFATGSAINLISIHALREESDQVTLSTPSLAKQFQSTPSARRATPDASEQPKLHTGFQSTPSARRATQTAGLFQQSADNFNPRPPRGERRRFCLRLADLFYFNPRPPRGERRDRAKRQKQSSDMISIHALREESDQPSRSQTQRTSYFNPRPPRGERRKDLQPGDPEYQFQSTPSARRATVTNPAAFTGGRISIHALREESDLLGLTPDGIFGISIHALREESDRSTSTFWDAPMYFNPRPPRGGRPARKTKSINLSQFQSTPSARRATISLPPDFTKCFYFNPRPPRGERQIDIHLLGCTDVFQSTPSARRATGA